MSFRHEVDWEDPQQKREVVRAYEQCRRIARREAKNFYYAFLALPAAKSSAMCAMYAFMRRADDIADDETMPLDERRSLMGTWREGFRTGAGVSDEDSTVFLAVRDTQRRFGIPDALLEELIAGTAMDLSEEAPEGVVRGSAAGRVFDCYGSVEALDRYCYLVASVVGLVTVRIFGVQGDAADEDAIRMGKAFQYTNILRDVREDAERGRVYLPLDVLRAHGAGVEDVATASADGDVSAGLQATMELMGTRAEEFYGARRTLLPLLARDSRPAMRVLIRIYHALLMKIRRKKYRVFKKRVSVSTARKLAILLRGLVGSFVSRIP